MSSQDESVNGVVLVFGLGDVGQPLGSQTGPLQGVSHDKVVQKRRVLLPYLVFLVDDPFWETGNVCNRNRLRERW